MKKNHLMSLIAALACTASAASFAQTNADNALLQAAQKRKDVLFNPDEEKSSLGASDTITKLSADQDYVLLFEPPEADVVTIATNGIAYVHLDVKGRNAAVELSNQIIHDDIAAALSCVEKMNIPLEYGPFVEPWGVHRFYVRDPFGKPVNVLAHINKKQ